MIKLKSLLVERIDYEDTARMLVKHYKLRSKVKFGRVKGSNEADYDWVKDVINLKRNYPSVKEFIVSVLHEIDHAKMRYKMGWKNTNTNIYKQEKKPNKKVVISTMTINTKNKQNNGHKTNIEKNGSKNLSSFEQL